MIRNFKNFVVKEEQEIVNDWKEIQKTKGFQQVKKIVESYGYRLDDASISRYKSMKRMHIDINGDIFKQPEIRYDSEHKEFEIAVGGGGFKNIKDTIELWDNLDNAIELCKKLSKMDLINILPIIDETV